MPAYLAHELDPESIYLDVDVPFLEHLEDLVQMAMGLAAAGKVVSINHDVEMVPQVDGTEKLVDVIGYRDYDADFFEKCYYQCPKDADDSWVEQWKDRGEPQERPRPFPSMLVTPSPVFGGQPVLVVAKPSLCDGCAHGLSKRMKGHCNGKAYHKLPEVLK